MFLADAATMADPEHPLLAVDSGRTRAHVQGPGPVVPEVSADLSIAKMDFAEFAGAASGSGPFRGFGEG
ncbi:DUF6924 domain-containing protein [Streptomyces sp. NPDC085946]|uniref:DUF6924 domain-containing protein n=1 Tax=Streptomyces sp. NPDC085946 TaxID=3365744 RepID=UPI0037CDA7E1